MLVVKRNYPINGDGDSYNDDGDYIYDSFGDGGDGGHDDDYGDDNDFDYDDDGCDLLWIFSRFDINPPCCMLLVIIICCTPPVMPSMLLLLLLLS